VRCHKPVKFAALYEIHEQMHFLCFHLEFEHGDYDPDEPCRDPGCYWRIDRLGAARQTETLPPARRVWTHGVHSSHQVKDGVRFVSGGVRNSVGQDRLRPTHVTPEQGLQVRTSKPCVA
jgi:hypothetical protein